MEALDLNDAISETSFGTNLEEVACDSVTEIDSKNVNRVKALRKDMLLGAWGLMKLETGGLDHTFCNATNLADETQLCTTEFTMDTLENGSVSGETDWPLVSETKKRQKDEAASDRNTFTQLGKELEE